MKRHSLDKQTAEETRMGRGAMRGEKEKADAAFSAMSEDERRELAGLGRFERPQQIERRYSGPDTLGVGAMGIWPLWVGIVEEMLEIWAASNGVVFKSMMRKRGMAAECRREIPEANMGLLVEVEKMLAKQRGWTTMGEGARRKIVEVSNDVSEAIQYLRDIDAILAQIPGGEGAAGQAREVSDTLDTLHSPIEAIQVWIEELLSAEPGVGKSGGRRGRIVSVERVSLGKQDDEHGKIVGGGDYGTVVSMVVELENGEERTIYFEHRAFGDMVEGLDLGDPPTLMGREVIVHGDPGQETVEFV